jgi:N-methylhydantoinase A
VRVGVDVGGTFTDAVAVWGARIAYAKVPSTPRDQAAGVMEALGALLAQLRARPDDVEVVVHGTTVATNTLLERRGARVGLLTTLGFRDVLHIGRQSRPALYDLYVRRPAPLVPRRFRCEVRERTLCTGEVETPIDPAEVERLACALSAAGIESIAICFLHAYAGAGNERHAAAVVRAAAPGIPVSASSEILPEMREFERMNTTVLNAYVQPAVGRYVERLAGRLREAGVGAPLHVMRSNGGVARAPQAAVQAVHTLLSGPAGGVLGAAFLAETTGLAHLITADVGGTSFDVSIVEGGRPAVATEGAIEGYPIKFPHLDIHTIGAGGGSIAWLDRAGALRVGPESAGADPGPICYGRGGARPTVTDAHAVLGRLGTLLAGEMPLDVEAGRRGLAERIGEPLGLTAEAAADGVLRVANAAMTRAIRVVTVERGVDPRGFTLVAFGGAGPLHAADLARSLGIGQVLVPVAPGNFSALGLLAAPVREDRVRAFRGRADTVDAAALAAAFGALEQDARASLCGAGFAAARIRCERSADLRYVGQAYELTVPVPAGPLGTEAWRRVPAAYHQAHARAYGFAKPGDPVEIVNVRLGAFVEMARPRWQAQEARPGRAAPAPAARRAVWFAGRWEACAVFRRRDLRTGDRCAGPAIIEEHGATTVLAPQDAVAVDAWGNLRIQVGPGAPRTGAGATGTGPGAAGAGDVDGR